mmetsp:Transcript_50599/g.122101  ORF Transcript_50599/g.122101 Transcript_50599/m.122101 type:complete len:500 (+) Transcript_50599:94-1593(+)
MTSNSSNLRGGGEAASSSSSSSSTVLDTIQRLYVTLALDQRSDVAFLAVLLACELLLGLIIITKVPYTEIDWIAYMEEVDGWYVERKYDYVEIKGGTGPLVYPAGFLYLFWTIQQLTNRGEEIFQVQRLFLGFYLTTQCVVLVLYTKVLRHDVVDVVVQQEDINNRTESSSSSSSTARKQDLHLKLQHCHKIWSFRIAMGCLCLSKRYHSIFLLRLFNDGPTMLVAYISFWLFVNQKWNWGCFVFSLAVSIKMNVLLFAPGLLYLLIEAHGPIMTIPRLTICAVTQLVLGAPFLLRHPISYLRKAFELDRQFFFKWTVNWKFLEEEMFLSKSWALLLLMLHVGLLIVYYYRLYYQSTYNNSNKTDSPSTTESTRTTTRRTSPQHILMTLFVSNFIGICCARTLHYQFYSWYFSSLPMLLWSGSVSSSTTTTTIASSYYSYPIWIRLCLLGLIEYAFLTFPATPTSSMCLQVAHWMTLIPCIINAGVTSDPSSTKKGKNN